MLRLAANLRSIVEQDGAVILDGHHNQITTLDAMGGYIWLRLEDGMTHAEITRHLAYETGEDPQVIERDVSELINDLQDRHLILGAEESANRLEIL